MDDVLRRCMRVYLVMGVVILCTGGVSATEEPGFEKKIEEGTSIANALQEANCDSWDDLKRVSSRSVGSFLDWVDVQFLNKMDCDTFASEVQNLPNWLREVTQGRLISKLSRDDARRAALTKALEETQQSKNHCCCAKCGCAIL